MRGIWRGYWPLLLAVAASAVVLCGFLVLSIRRNDGHLIYPLDDTYIHMAMARNLACHGVWGITRYEFSSTSSSPLWTLLLSGVYRAGGVSEAAPLVLNALFAVLLLAALDAIGQARQVAPPIRAAVLLGVALLLPLTSLVLMGMEHVLHALVVVLVAHEAGEALAQDGPAGVHRRRLPPEDGGRESGDRPARCRFPADARLLVLAAVAPAVRYESLFLLCAVGLMLAARGQWRRALALGAASLAPVLLYGVVSKAQGWYWLPNSVLLKSAVLGGPPGGLLMAIADRSFKYLWISAEQKLLLDLTVALGLAAVLVGARRGSGGGRRLTYRQAIAGLATMGLLVHLQLGQVAFTGYRYEAYLVALAGVLCLAYAGGTGDGRRGTGPSALALPSRPRNTGDGRWETGQSRRMLAACTLAAPMAILLVLRGAASLGQAVVATQNIYEQQYQMGTFLRRFYGGAAVAANDIGAINFLADIRCLDLWGLGSRQAADRRLAGDFSPQGIAALSREQGVRIAIVYDAWFAQGLPAEWTRVGQWAIRDNRICGDDTVTFYAVNTREAGELAAHLVEFAHRLPAGVIQSLGTTERPRPPASRRKASSWTDRPA